MFSHITQMNKHWSLQHGPEGGEGKREESLEEMKTATRGACDTAVCSRSECNILMKNHGSKEQLQYKGWEESFQEKHSFHRNVLKINSDDPGDVNNCPICKRSFVREAELIRHEKTHQWIQEEIGNFLSHCSSLECCACELAFTGVKEVKEHYIQHVINNDTYRCLMCLTQFTGEDNVLSLLYHMVTNHGKKTPFQCQECFKYFPDRVRLQRHSLSHSPPKQVTCSVCNMVFKRQYRLNIHMNKHTGDHPYKCSECEMSFQSPRSLAKHKRYHAGKSFDCDICHQVLSDKCALLDHRARVHTGPDLINCQECGVPFSSKMFLSVHMRNVHGFTEKDQPTAHQCKVCYKYYKTASSLISHAKTHDQATHTCEICHRGFISENNLQQHMRVHLSSSGKVTTENYRKCRYCDKEFSSRKQCAKHMVSHTKEKPHACEVCGRRYGLKASLAKHMVSCHMTEEDINAVLDCDICGKRCFSVEGLEQHMSSHTLIVDHICVECGDSFTKSKDLKEHRKLVHSEHGQLKSQAGPRKDSARNVSMEVNSGTSCPVGVGVLKRCGGKEGEDRSTYKSSAKLPRYYSAIVSNRMNDGTRKELRVCFEGEKVMHQSFNDKHETDVNRLVIEKTAQEDCTKCSSHDHLSEDLSSMPDDKQRTKNDNQELAGLAQRHKDVCQTSDTVSHDSGMTEQIDVTKDERFRLSDNMTTKPMIPCSPCDSSCSLDLQRHVPVVHEKSVKELPKCSVCSINFTDENYLKEHVKIHTANEPVKQKEQDSSSACKLNEKSYKCSFCDEMFVRSSLLEKHVKAHSKDDKMWRFHLVDVQDSQPYVCVHIDNISLSCPKSYDTL